MSTKAARTLEAIGSELQAALRTQGRNLLHIGALLLEAKNKVPHGGWLPWLKENFGGGHSSASNYMAAARFAIKFPSVGNLKLRPGALYLLAQNMDQPTGLYDGDALEAIFREAETAWVDEDRAREIAIALYKIKEEERLRQEKESEGDKDEEPETDEEEPETEEEEEQSIDDILDGPPPELPPTPKEERNLDREAFDQAITTLARLYTKPLNTFAGTEHDARLIYEVGSFLVKLSVNLGGSETLTEDQQLDAAKFSDKSRMTIDKAIALHKKRLDKAFEWTVFEEVQRQIAKADDACREQNRELRMRNFHLQSLLTREAMFDATEFKAILMCLHPDNSASVEVRARAFDLVRQKEERLVRVAPAGAKSRRIGTR